MSDPNESQEEFRQYLEELFNFNHAMLVTRDWQDNGLHSRPMSIAGRTENGSVWFITKISSTTIKDVTEHPEVNLCLQNGQHYVSVSGTARTSRDPRRIRQLWNAGQSAWFEKGIDDPELVLIEIVPTYAEYWDRSGKQGVRFALTEIAALATGRTLEEGEGYRKGSVDFADPAGSRRH